MLNILITLYHVVICTLTAKVLYSFASALNSPTRVNVVQAVVICVCWIEVVRVNRRPHCKGQTFLLFTQQVYSIIYSKVLWNNNGLNTHCMTVLNKPDLFFMPRLKSFQTHFALRIVYYKRLYIKFFNQHIIYTQRKG